MLVMQKPINARVSLTMQSVRTFVDADFAVQLAKYALGEKSCALSTIA